MSRPRTPTTTTAAAAPAMRVDHRQDRSTGMRFLHGMIRPLKPRLSSVSKTWPAGSPKLNVPKHVHKFCAVTERKVDDIYVYDLVGRSSPLQKSKAESQENGSKPSVLRLYYFCGGSWQIPPSPAHWRFLRELAATLSNIIVTVISPPLAPASPAVVTLPQLMKLYKGLMETSRAAEETVIFGGDSSGANLALSVVLDTLMREGVESSPRPRAMLVISPSVNLKPFPKKDTYKQADSKDPVLAIETHNREVEQWIGELDPTEARISPLNAEVEVLTKAGVKLYGLTGSYDILTPDALLFREKCIAAGVEGEWLHWDGQMHVFPMAFNFGLRESKEGKDWVVDKLKSLGA